MSSFRNVASSEFFPTRERVSVGTVICVARRARLVLRFKYHCMIKYYLTVFALLFSLGVAAQNDYPIHFDKDAPAVSTDRPLRGVTFTTSAGTRRLNITTPKPYTGLTSETPTARPGDRVTVRFDYGNNGTTWMHGYVFLDRNFDGNFTTDGDLLAYSYYQGKDMTGRAIAANAQGYGSALNPPTFQLPATLVPGRYRVRFKVDWDNIDPAGALGSENNVKGKNGILTNRGAIVDTWLEVKGKVYTESRLSLDTHHANIYGVDGALPMAVPGDEPLTLRVVTPDKGYELMRFAVRYGKNLNGAATVNGEQQWTEQEFTPAADGKITLPASVMQGDVRVIAHYEPGKNAKYLPGFVDEFDAPDASQPNDKVWSRTPRRNPTWARFHSDSPLTVFVQNGELVCRAMATPASLKAAGEEKDFITGGVKTEGRYNFRYGRAEARIFTTPHSGNFPAFWMMPAKSKKGWPHEGEIDIWEQINNENTAYHTLHSHWTFNLKHKNDPMSHYVTGGLDYSRYHTFAVEWTPTTIVWSGDGKVTGTAVKSTDSNALANGQWPYTEPFYLILNQSVGDGSWAAKPDMNFVYETRFDWVRVYQTREQNPLVGIEAVKTDEKPRSEGTSAEEVPAAGTAKDEIFDLSGRKVKKTVGGVQIRAGRKVLVGH